MKRMHLRASKTQTKSWLCSHPRNVFWTENCLFRKSRPGWWRSSSWWTPACCSWPRQGPSCRWWFRSWRLWCHHCPRRWRPGCHCWILHPWKVYFFYCERCEFIEGSYPGESEFSIMTGVLVVSSLWTEAARPRTISTRDSLKDNIVLFSSKVANRLSLWVMRPPGW